MGYWWVPFFAHSGPSKAMAPFQSGEYYENHMIIRMVLCYERVGVGNNNPNLNDVVAKMCINLLINDLS